MSFPLSHLPVELALEILRLASSTQTSRDCQSRRQIYNTPRALALVSHNIRQVVMPHLLYTVILDSQLSVNLFARTLQQQNELAFNRSRLSLHYTQLVRHMWSSQCWGPIVQQQDNFQSYSLLYEIFSKAETLGFNFQSLHLLYDVLGGVHSASHNLRYWSCKRVTFSGHSPRWNPLISTANGLAFLKQLTHLTIWVPEDDSIGGTSDSGPGGVPNWITRVPFDFMPNLTHFAFSLISIPATRIPVLVYTLPPTLRSQSELAIFKNWATSTDPLAYGEIVHLNVGSQTSTGVAPEKWEMAYLQRENDIWPISRSSEQ